jgi:hypothetical protein
MAQVTDKTRPDATRVPAELAEERTRIEQQDQMMSVSLIRSSG